MYVHECSGTSQHFSEPEILLHESQIVLLYINYSETSLSQIRNISKYMWKFYIKLVGLIVPKNEFSSKYKLKNLLEN